MRHTWLLKTIVGRCNIASYSFRYNNDMSDLTNVGHQIECKIRPIEREDGFITTVYVGPYFNLDDAQEDMNYLQREKQS
jgi:hypothetical protein